MYTCLKLPLYQNMFPLIVSSHYIQFIGISKENGLVQINLCYLVLFVSTHS